MPPNDGIPNLFLEKIDMSIFTIWALRLFGLSGITGSLLFIMGDLLYGHIPGSQDSPTLKMSRLPQARLLNAGLLGLFGCWLYPWPRCICILLCGRPGRFLRLFSCWLLPP
jgi:hypothetical protein